jgi:polar amino acid transport system permease protein
MLSRNVLFSGFLNTFTAAVSAIFLATIIGVLIGFIMTYGNAIIKFPFRLFIDIIRGIPGLVTIFTVYYFLDFILKSYFNVVLSSFAAGIIALTVPSSAQVAELARGALQNIHKGQIEAGQAIGMKFSNIFFYILLPQALVQMIPPWTNSATEIVKGTTMLSLIGITELLLTANQLIGRNGNALFYYTAVGIIFFLLNTLIELLGKTLERKMRIRAK